MKTLDEAFELSCPVVKMGDEESLSLPDLRGKAAVKQAKETHARYWGIAREFIENPRFQAIQASVLVAVATSKVEVHDAILTDAILTVFMLGLQTGVEMEKNDDFTPRTARRPWWKLWGRNRR